MSQNLTIEIPEEDAKRFEALLDEWLEFMNRMEAERPACEEAHAKHNQQFRERMAAIWASLEQIKNNRRAMPNDMLPEYDLRQMRIVKRGPGHELRKQNVEPAQLVTVALDPDVAAVFDNEQAVNEALRTLLR